MEDPGIAVLVLGVLALFAAFILWLLWVVLKGFIAQMPSQRRKRRLRYCYCGYDLTANETGICPECGTRIPWRKPPEAVAKMQPVPPGKQAE